MIKIDNQNFEMLGNNQYRNVSTNAIVDGNSFSNYRNIHIGSGNNLVHASIGNTEMTICDLSFLRPSRLKVSLMKKINSIQEIILKNDWSEIKNFKEKDMLVNAKGKPIKDFSKQPHYRIVSKAERSFTSGERKARKFLGVLAIMSVIGILFFFKSTINLFTQEKKNLLFALRV